MTRDEAVKASKEIRRDADALLQRMKEQRRRLQTEAWTGSGPDDFSEVIANHVLSIRDLESAIMRQGMVLKNIGGEKPYPTSYDPSSPKVEPVADGLKL